MCRRRGSRLGTPPLRSRLPMYRFDLRFPFLQPPVVHTMPFRHSIGSGVAADSLPFSIGTTPVPVILLFFLPWETLRFPQVLMDVMYMALPILGAGMMCVLLAIALSSPLRNCLSDQLSDRRTPRVLHLHVPMVPL